MARWVKVVTVLLCLTCDLQFVAAQNNSDFQSTNEVLTMCYLIEQNTLGTTYDYNKAAAALDLAMGYANDVIMPSDLKLRSVHRDIGRVCSYKSHIVSIAMELQDEGVNCSVIIGPGCGMTVETLYTLVSVWDIPIIGCPAAELGLSAPASEYATVSRTSITFVSITMVLVRFLTSYNYTTPVIFQDQSVNFYQLLGDVMRMTIQQKSPVLRYGAKYVSFSSATATPDAIQQQMLTASMIGRCFVVCSDATTVRKFMTWARLLQMTKGDYVFIAIDPYPSQIWGYFTWEKNDTFDLAAREAYHSLALLSLQISSSESTLIFWRQVIKTALENYNFKFSPVEQTQIDPIVTHFYDAVLLYANTVVSMRFDGLPYKSGLHFTNEVANFTFDSPVSGKVVFNADSDRLLGFELRFFNNKSGKHEAMLGFRATTDNVRILGQLEWLGQAGLPPNAPFCGFRDENPACHPTNTLSVGGKAGLAIGIVLVLAGIGAGGYFIAQKIMFSNLDPFWWRILEQDLIIRTGTKSTKSMTSSVVSGASGGPSVPADKTEDTRSAGSLFGPKNSKTATYNNLIVSILELPEPKIRVPPNISRDAFMIRSMQHNNIQTFLGICVNDANLCDYIVGEVCQKGSLQDLIEDQRMQLDWEFKNALTKDLTNGMVYIHSSPIQSHGFLTDAVCLIDSRFVLKVGGFGLDSLRRKEDLDAYHPSQADHRDLRILLWRAPELLRRAVPPGGTPKGDVYSFSILLQQIILRTEPFQKGHHHHGGKENTLNPADIVYDVCRGLTPPLRPPVPMSACSHEIHQLMENCWSEDAQLRPTFVRIRTIIQNATKKSGDNIVDHLIKRMETYAAELENEVLKKTKEFMDERQRSAELLGEILPKAVGEALAKGQQVLPETFPSTTVCFSSVVGFKEAVAQAKTPLETVTMLNNLYSVCDGIICNLDVFKVEVVGDAYLVVSGLPIRNGQRHVEQIATMSLALRKEVGSLMHSTVKLRVGMHSGPCVAGVVGLKMPRYCLFGDTVNTSSRMESHGEAGKIHVSPSSKALLDLHDDFVLVERGVINVKGKGDMMTYWLIGRN